jgi:hypothetical protein
VHYTTTVERSQNEHTPTVLGGNGNGALRPLPRVAPPELPLLGGGGEVLHRRPLPCLARPPPRPRVKEAPPSFTIQAPKEKIEMYSLAFYAACTAGGVASCGLTHMMVTPLDLVKCNMQVMGG